MSSIVRVFISLLFIVSIYGCSDSNEDSSSKELATSNERGLTSDDIEGFAFYFDIKFSNIYMNVWLFLKDGTVYIDYEDIYYPPSEFDVELSKKQNPTAWRKWRKDGDWFEIQNSKTGEWYDFRTQNTGFTGPHSENLLLNKRYVATSSSAGENYAVVKKYYIDLYDDGRFETSTKGWSGYSDFGASTSSYSSSDKDSTTKQTTIGSSGAYGSSQIENNSKDYSKTGRYYVGDYSLELRYDNGRVVRLLFLSFDEYENPYIGNRVYGSK